MIERALAASLAAGLLVLAQHGEAPSAPPTKVALCALLADPVAYDRELIEVTGDVSHGFEHFQFSDGACMAPADVWLEYGGRRNSNTVYCCGTTANAKRPRTLVVEGITLPLVEDEIFKQFDARIMGEADTAFRATLVGRFFAGELQTLPAGKQWGGYGHLGCCTLFVIQRVITIEPSARSASAGR